MFLLRQEVAENWAEDGVYIGFLGMGVELSRVRIGGISSPEHGLFTLKGGV